MLLRAFRAWFRAVLPRAVIAIAMLSIASSALAQTNVTWIGGTGNWNSASNWSPAVIPNNSGGNLFNVFIDGGNLATSHVTLLGGADIWDLTIDSGDSLTAGGLFVNGLFTVGGTLNSGSLFFIGQGTVLNGGVFNNYGFLNSSGSQSLVVNGLFHNHTNGNIFSVDGMRFGGTGTVVNDGSIVIGSLSNSIGIFVNREGGLFVLGANSSLFASNSFHNAGTVVLAPIGGEIFAPLVTNTGYFAIQQDGGHLNTTTYTQTSGHLQADGIVYATILAINGGTLSGHGLINGDVSMAGEFSPGHFSNAIVQTPVFFSQTGIMNVTGNYTQTAGGIFTAELGGLFAGSGVGFSPNPPDAQYDQLIVSGNACLDGILNILLVNNFMPQLGDSFTIVQFGSLTCTFDAIHNANFAPGLMFTVQYNPNDVTLLVSQTSEPGTLLLFASGLSGVFWARRRRPRRTR